MAAENRGRPLRPVARAGPAPIAVHGLAVGVEFSSVRWRMARPEDIDTAITLELEGSEITPEKFRKGVVAFIGLLEALTKTVCRDAPAVEWRMQVKSGSNLVGAFVADGANAAHVRKILALAALGLDQFEIEGEVPPVYPDNAVRYVRDLSTLAARRPDDDTRVSVWVERKRREITVALSAAAKSALGAGFDEYGTVEGKLSVLSERQGVHFVVYERVWDHPVTCTVAEHLLDTLMALWRKRVAVHGVVHYRPDGMPSRIHAEEVEALPEDDDLPTHEDVLGILRESV